MKIAFRFIFSVLIILSIYVAHNTSSDIFNFVHMIGLDIPMTPFTSDMALMTSKNKNEKAYYQKSFYLRYQTIKGYFSIDETHLDLYEFKIPFQWLSECKQYDESCEHVIYYLCRSIEHTTHQLILSWSVQETNAEVKIAQDGLFLEYRCPVK